MRPLVICFIALMFGAGLAFNLSTAAPQSPSAAAPVYDESADAAKDIANAVRIAGLENQRVLLDIGGNWCGWCTLLNNLFETGKDVSPLLHGEYIIVNVDIGHGEKNAGLLSAYGIKASGYPYLAILDPANKLVTQQETGALENGPAHDPQKVLAFLNKWKPTPPDAQKVLGDALDDARAHDKRVFLYFGAPWCIWCHRLEDVLYQPAVTDAIGSDYVMVKIDMDRMTNATRVSLKYQSSAGIPWYAILSPGGKVVSTSDLTPGNNIGFPGEPEEIDHVMHMFTDGHKHMTDEQIKLMRDAFIKAAAAVKAAEK